METNTKQNIMVASKIRRYFGGGDSKEEKNILQIFFFVNEIQENVFYGGKKMKQKN